MSSRPTRPRPSPQPRGGDNVFLTGFMTSGKTTAGRLLARSLGWRFVDLDREIERRTRHRVATLFRLHGEPGFRALETAQLREVARGRRQVVALGGGALLEPVNQRLVREAGLLVFLSVRPETVLERLEREPGKRPLLSGLNGPGGRSLALRRIRGLLRARAKGYRQAVCRVTTEGRSPRQVARELARQLEDVAAGGLQFFRKCKATRKAEGRTRRKLPR